MKLISLLVLLSSLALAGWTKVALSTPHGQTQAELSAAAGSDLKAAEAEMSLLLDDLKAKVTGKTTAIAKLNNSQTAWKAYSGIPAHGQSPPPRERIRHMTLVPSKVRELANTRLARTAEMCGRSTANH